MRFDNKFGMFVHWGLYSVTEYHEQALARLDMDNEEYEALIDKFNPVNYNPEEWVLAAKNAGMKYICFTAKHHDGFCMWDTAYSEYNIMNTPYKKDVLKMLSDACSKHGLLLSIYYSIPDWHHQYGYNPASSHQWKAKKDKIDTAIYREYIKNQVTELLTNYGKIYTFFWDISPKIEDKSINELIRKLQPGIRINDRGYDAGDFSTPEREYTFSSGALGNKTAVTARFENICEACNSVSVQSWGYRREDDYYSTRHLTCAIDRIMAMGGSYLLNVGPKPDGTIPERHLLSLARIGDWYRRTEGCLEGADDDSFDYEPKKVKYIANKKDGKTYLHFYEGLASTAAVLKNYPGMPTSVRLMNTGKFLPYEICALPEYCGGGKPGVAHDKYLRIHEIPVDDLAAEPVILEIEWGKGNNNNEKYL